MEKMKNCKACGKEISKSAKSCPFCGASNKKPFYKKWWVWAVAIIVVIAICNSGNDDATTTKNSNSTDTTSTSASQPETKNDKQDKTPTEYKSALKKAKIYSDDMHMSKQRIYEQLTSEYGEKFPAEAAQYAVDNLEADYNKNALQQAKTYQKEMDMSKSAIYDQLTSEYGEKFTPDEAQYAVDNLE